jgi:peptide/nickel transport system permease protein
LGLKTYILKRFAYMIVLIFFVLTLNFIIFELIPGTVGIITNLIGSGKAIPAWQIAALEKLYGIDQPIQVRYVKYMYNMATLQFGLSFRTDQPVLSDMIAYLPNTLVLLGISSVLAIVIGIGIGILSAHKRGGAVDTTSVIASLTTFSLPTFWMGLLLLAVLSLQLRWFPFGGSGPAEWLVHPPSNIFDLITTRIWYAVLPVTVLTIFQYGFYVLLTRATMLEALNEDYITTARAKGLPERTVLVKHAFKNASLPLVTSVSLALAGILGGAIITETVFRWPGIGLWTFNSIEEKDIPVLQAIFYITALAVIIANFVADLIYGMIDPRIKYS